MLALRALDQAPIGAGDLSGFCDVIAVTSAEKGRGVCRTHGEFDCYLDNDCFVRIGGTEAITSSTHAEVTMGLKTIELNPSDLVAIQQFTNIPLIDWAQKRNLQEKQNKTVGDYEMLWKYKFCQYSHLQNRGDIFDAMYCDAHRKGQFYRLLELGEQMTKAREPKKTIPDYIPKTVAQRITDSLPGPVRAVETLDPAKYRLQEAADVLCALDRLENVHSTFTSADLQKDEVTEVLDRVLDKTKLLGLTASGNPCKADGIAKRRKWGLKTIMKLTFGLVLTSRSVKRTQINGIRTRTYSFTLKWPTDKKKGLPKIPKDTWSIVVNSPP